MLCQQLMLVGGARDVLFLCVCVCFCDRKGFFLPSCACRACEWCSCIHANMHADSALGATSAALGRLGGGSRVDFVLQESPAEAVSEQLSALTAHDCYWRSEDVVLFMLLQIYEPIISGPSA